MRPLSTLFLCSPRPNSQGDLWGAGCEDDYQATTAKTGEPVIRTMALEGNTDTPRFELPATSLSAFELWQVQKKRAEMRKEHLDLWESTKSLTGTGRPVDAIISPTAPYTATPHGQMT